MHFLLINAIVAAMNYTTTNQIYEIVEGCYGNLKGTLLRIGFVKYLYSTTEES